MQALKRTTIEGKRPRISRENKQNVYYQLSDRLPRPLINSDSKKTNILSLNASNIYVQTLINKSCQLVALYKRQLFLIIHRDLPQNSC